MRPIFANSAFVTAPERLVLRGGRWRRLALRVRYGLVIHPVHGPILIDTGYTAHALSVPHRSLGLRLYGALLGPSLVEAEQPGKLLERFGLAYGDVRIVVVTHFHADHVSGLALFPNARFIADEQAFSQIRGRSYLPNMRHGLFPELLPQDFEARLDGLTGKPLSPLPNGAGQGFDLLGDGSMLAVSLPGHAEGHFGILFATTPRPLFYGVDAQWMLGALTPGRAPRFPASLVASHPTAMEGTARRLLALQAAGVDLILCHDPAPTAYDFPEGNRDA